MSTAALQNLGLNLAPIYPSDMFLRRGMRSAVAINPLHMYLPRSNHKSLLEQVDMVSRLPKSLNIPGSLAMIAGLSDYCDIILQHLKDTGQLLFDIGFNRNYLGSIRTTTTTQKRVVAGIFRSEESRLTITNCPAHIGSYDVYAVPVFVPAPFLFK